MKRTAPPTQSEGKKKFPIRYRIHGRETGVVLYRRTRTKDGYTYSEYTLSTPRAGEGRKLQWFTNLENAEREALDAANKVVNGHVVVLNLTGTDREIYVEIKQRADRLGRSLLTILNEYEAAVEKLAGRGSVIEAATFFAEHAPGQASTETVQQVLDDWTARKSKDSSDSHVHTMKVVCGAAAKHFGARSLAGVPSKELDDYIDSCGGAKRTRYNIRAALISLWRYAQARGHLPREKKTQAELTLPIVGGKKVGKVVIYTPEEMELLLAKQSFQTLPFVAVGAFSGVRTEERGRLRWSDFKWERGHIDISAEVAKTDDRRLVPITPALASFLAPYRELLASGAIDKNSLITFGYARAHEAAKDRAEYERRDPTSGKVSGLPSIEWKKNALRHCYCSYRLAHIQSVGQVAEESGNSESVIKSNYREVVYPEDAQRYWGLRPQGAQILRIEASPVSGDSLQPFSDRAPDEAAEGSTTAR